MACCCGTPICECPNSRPLTYYLSIACTSGPSDYFDGLSGPMNYAATPSCQWVWAEGPVTEICYPNSANTSSVKPNLFFKNFRATFAPVLISGVLYLGFGIGAGANAIYTGGTCTTASSPLRTFSFTVPTPTILWADFCSAPSGTIFDIPFTWSSTAPGTYPNSSYIASITD